MVLYEQRLRHKHMVTTFPLQLGINWGMPPIFRYPKDRIVGNLHAHDIKKSHQKYRHPHFLLVQAPRNRGTHRVTSAGALGTDGTGRPAGAFACATHRLGGIREHLWPMFGHEAWGRSDLGWMGQYGSGSCRYYCHIIFYTFLYYM